MSYIWDDANRLTQLTQAAGTINGGTARVVTFQYDDANRRTEMVLPNGVTAAYTYDNANELVEIDYARSDTTVIGNLTYTYDAAGHRTSAGGSLANVTIPTVATSGTYDADNRLTQLNSVSRLYDANGSLTSDGTSTYTWNARNELVAMSGSTTASFAYDGIGRRTQRTVGGVTRQYLYDGSDYAQEQDASGTVSAALLKGGTDELLGRMTPTAISSPLTDGLGSVVAETDLSQTIITTYSYDPYGNTSMSGTSTGNPLNYVGRENDFPGLYFYRARYLEPLTGRFLSQDPLGLAAGPNRYTYVDDDPIDSTDPYGWLPGDPFSSPGQAAVDALNYINQWSIALNAEFAGVIYQDPADGQYYATPPEQGGIAGDENWPLHYPPNKTPVGDYHTHATHINADGCRTSAGNDTSGADHFSRSDKEWTPPSRPWTRYLGTPSGRYWQYTPGWFSVPGPIK